MAKAKTSKIDRETERTKRAYAVIMLQNKFLAADTDGHKEHLRLDALLSAVVTQYFNDHSVIQQNDDPNGVRRRRVIKAMRAALKEEFGK